MHPARLDGAVAARLPIVVGGLSDAELEDRLKRLAGIERTALALLLAHLGEFDERRLHADLGQPSLFSYCTRVLGYSEQAAYKRIQAARAARAHPEILRRLAKGSITLTAVVILSPHLRPDNLVELLEAVRGRRTREVEALAAGLSHRPDGPDCLRALPSRPEPQRPSETTQQASGPGGQAEVAGIVIGAGCAAPPHPRESVEPLSAQRHLFRFTGSSALRGKYERAKELLGMARASGSMETVIETGLDALLDRLDPERRIARRRAREARQGANHRETKGDATTPMDRRRPSRRISAPLRDAVWQRDDGRCTFMGPDGTRCPATTRLEIDHVRPYALGGSSDDAANLRLMCRAHNQLLARRMFGPGADLRRRNPES